MSKELSDEERRRALSRYSRMKGRSVNPSFPALGPVVDASNPEELEDATNQAVVADSEDQDPS